MSRPRRNEHQREAILEAGALLFARQGYHATGLKSILDAVQVPKGSFYNYFNSKEHFAAEVIRHYTRIRVDRFERFASNSRKDPIQTIIDAYGFWCDEMEASETRQGCLLGNLAMEVAGESEICRNALQEGVQRWKRQFAALVKSAQISGNLRNDLSASELTDLFWSAWEGTILRAKIESRPDWLRAVVPFLLGRVFAPAVARSGSWAASELAQV